MPTTCSRWPPLGSGLRALEIPGGDRGADQPRKSLKETEVQITFRNPLEKQPRKSLEETEVLCHCASGGACARRRIVAAMSSRSSSAFEFCMCASDAPARPPE